LDALCAQIDVRVQETALQVDHGALNTLGARAGLLAHLGSRAAPEAPVSDRRRQFAGALEDGVESPDEGRRHLARIGRLEQLARAAAA
jgi:hypothetical protein